MTRGRTFGINAPELVVLIVLCVICGAWLGVTIWTGLGMGCTR